jgi:hypothetical protein
MDDPTHLVVKTTPDMKRAFRGSRSQAGAPFFLPGRFGFCATPPGTTMEFLLRDATVHPAVKLTRSVLRGSSIQFFRNRDSCLTQHMLHLRFAQP